jgi:hypothetical protein
LKAQSSDVEVQAMLVAVHAADALFFVAALARRRTFATPAAMRLGGNVEGEK